MATRAVSAGLLTPLAVLVPILATALGAFWAVTFFPPLALLVIAAGLVTTAVAGRATYGTRTALVAAGFTLLAAVLSLPLWYGVSISTSICGKVVDTAWVWLPPTVGALVFFTVGAYGFRTDRSSSVVPMAFLFGVLATLLLFAAVPGAPGTCET